MGHPQLVLHFALATTIWRFLRAKREMHVNKVRPPKPADRRIFLTCVCGLGGNRGWAVAGRRRYSGNVSSSVLDTPFLVVKLISFTDHFVKSVSCDTLQHLFLFFFWFVSGSVFLTAARAVRWPVRLSVLECNDGIMCLSYVKKMRECFELVS